MTLRSFTLLVFALSSSLAACGDDEDGDPMDASQRIYRVE